jgi:hypothetical protein
LLVVIPDQSDPRWDKLVRNPAAHNYDFLALKIFMQRIARKNADCDDKTRADLVAELHGFFQKNESMLGTDIQTIFA